MKIPYTQQQSSVHPILMVICMLATGFFATACEKGNTREPELEKRSYIEHRNEVDVMVLEKGSFKKELVSNGKLSARAKGEIKLKVGGALKELKVRNGQHVQIGETLGVLDQFEYIQKLKKAETAEKNAYLELQDVLLGQGFVPSDSSKIPLATMEMAKIRSGYANALDDLASARYELQSTVIVAPFTGKIASLNYKIHEFVGAGEVFCTLIDDREFEVDFYLIESEVHEIKTGESVQIIPFAIDKHYRGRVSEINPVVDEHGLVLVKAVLQNPGELIEGMNVKVLAERLVAGQMIVPKQAVVLRQNQEVLFKYTGGKAYWTYVHTLFENSTEYAVIPNADKGASLLAGDTVIISNNLNLAHDSNVEIKSVGDAARQDQPSNAAP
jgi:membrane fusion protein, multidrug efflux system